MGTHQPRDSKKLFLEPRYRFVSLGPKFCYLKSFETFLEQRTKESHYLPPLCHHFGLERWLQNQWVQPHYYDLSLCYQAWCLCGSHELHCGSNEEPSTYLWSSLWLCPEVSQFWHFYFCCFFIKQTGFVIFRPFLNIYGYISRLGGPIWMKFGILIENIKRYLCKV